MAEFQNSTCPNCGSPLDVKPGDTRIKCSYCGSSIVVSEHENSTPEAPQFTFKIDDRTAHEIGTVGKVTAGIAISSIILPIVITVVVLCGVGIILFFVFANVNSTIKSINVLPLEPTLIVAPTAAPPYRLPYGRSPYRRADIHTLPNTDPVCECTLPGRFLQDFQRLGPGARNGLHPGI